MFDSKIIAFVWEAASKHKNSIFRFFGFMHTWKIKNEHFLMEFCYTPSFGVHINSVVVEYWYNSISTGFFIDFIRFYTFTKLALPVPIPDEEKKLS